MFCAEVGKIDVKTRQILEGIPELNEPFNPISTKEGLEKRLGLPLHSTFQK